ncbi:MAG: class II aldolase/adducin family protein [Acidimicrobiales bacterium]
MSGPERGPLDALVALSRWLGGDPELVLAGGGNTSAKLGDRLLVKASGTALSEAGPGSFVELDRKALQALADRDLGTSRSVREAAFAEALLSARRQPGLGQRPSVESVLHHLMPGQFVAHVHANLVNQFACSGDGRRLIEQDSREVLWVRYVDPGFALAQVFQAELRSWREATGDKCPTAVVMQNHGLLVSGETLGEVKRRTTAVLRRLQRIKARACPGKATGTAATGTAAAPLTSSFAPALAARLARTQEVAFDSSAPVAELFASACGRELALGGPLTPDQIVYCGSLPVWAEQAPGEGTAALGQRLEVALREHTERHRTGPTVVLVRPVGLFALAETAHEAETAQTVYLDAIKVMLGAACLGGVNYLDEGSRTFIEDWEVEAYRRRVHAGPPRTVPLPKPTRP